MRRIYLLHFVLAIALLFTFGGAAQSLAADHQVQGMDSLEEVLRDVQLLHISDPDSQTLIKGAIDGLLKTLNDPYTSYMTPEELRELRNSIDGRYMGIGVQMQPGEIYPKVLNTIENTPASKAGIMPGDRIIKIDGTDISHEPLGKIVERIRGPEETKLTLTIRREGNYDFNVVLTRANISNPTVTGKILDDGIGYIHINMFGDFTGDEFAKTLNDLQGQGAAKLILDLRDNPGGIIHSALSVSSNFIEQGKVVLSTFDRRGNREEYLAEWSSDSIDDMPIVVLVNEYSASAAELVAGALQDYGRATLIGGQTFGKGTVQAVIPLETGGALKITVARYHTPRGRAIDGTGLSPDIQVLTPGLSLAVAYAYLNGNSGNTIIFDGDKNEIMVNGVTIRNERVIQLQGKTYLPLRLLFEFLGYRVDWLPDERAVKAAKFQSEAFFYPGDGYYIVNGQTYPVAAAVLSIEGHLYIQDSLATLFNAGVRHMGSTVIIEKGL
ncbi:MAG: S41 family peptidase [Desulfotomaculaceae bacterium]|nr:S41 family peptidase [Desulfotomaculaceae bacterium]